MGAFASQTPLPCARYKEGRCSWPGEQRLRSAEQGQEPRDVVLTQRQQTQQGNSKESATFTMPCGNCETTWPGFLDMGAIPVSLMLSLPLDNNPRTCTQQLNAYSPLSSSSPAMCTATMPDGRELTNTPKTRVVAIPKRICLKKKNQQENVERDQES